MKSLWSILLLGLISLWPVAVRAQTCTTTVTGPASIQAAVNAASPGDVICLAGTFHQSVQISAAQSGITLTSADPSAPAVLDGRLPADPGTTLIYDAIQLLEGVNGVSIQNLDIGHYTSADCCGEGNAIQAWGVNTSNIEVKNNYMHDNSWDATLVGSDGPQMSTGWSVHDNTITNNGAYNLELTNCSGCSAANNVIDAGIGQIGVLIQARNTIANSGQLTVSGVSVKNNTITETAAGALGGIFIYAQAAADDFSQISDAYSKLASVSIVGNTVTSGLGAYVFGYAGDALIGSLGPAQVINPALVKNTFNCTSGGTGITLYDVNTINAKVVNDTFTGCTTDVGNSGTATKLPRSHN